ncbi:MAG: response regulator transcription factor [Candidatus Zixiibacteriota bacterium]
MAKESILVIEDEKDIQELIKYNLSREGYRVHCVMSGEEGLTYVRTYTPQLVVLDVLLPGLDGFEVCRILKANKDTQHIPVIMVTAKSEDADVVTGLEIGANDYLTKPFSAKVLIARIRALLRRKASDDTIKHDPIQIHELQINPGRYEVLANGKEISFSYTEFRILMLLAKSPGWVFSRYQIVNEVRGEDSIVTDRSVDVHITGLRKKLGSYGKYIETVRGVGYRFSDKSLTH